MQKLNFDYSKARMFVNEHEVKYMESFVKSAHEMLHNKTGAGNDFVGWVDLPINYDKEEFEYDFRKCEVDQDKCIGCKMCVNTGCPAIQFDKTIKKSSIDASQCVGCEVCMQVCPVKAISKVGE